MIHKRKIISVITNFIVGNKRNEFSQGKNNDVFSILNTIITSNNLFLNSNGNLYAF